MCYQTSPVYPMQCILPPHMVEAIKLRGDSKQREMAAAIQKEAETARDAREGAAPPEAFMAAPTLGRGAKPKAQREVYDGQKRAALPGNKARFEGDPKSKDGAVNKAYDGAGAVHKLYRDAFQRDSLDGNGMTLISTVHHRNNYNNAFWNGSQMAYGDGDGIIFKSLVGSLTVIGHELSHGVVQFSGGLVYRDQSGALNESFADVFGCLTEQFKKKQDASEANWLIGAGILGNGINGEALRSMKAPGTAYDDAILGKDPQPFHMSAYVNTSADRGGVHINSGISNHAFYLLAQYLGGAAWEKAGTIWYETMQQINNPLATFADWADKTVEVARGIHGSGSREALFTRRAWKLVGINV